MEIVAAFLVGYLLGIRQSRDGMERFFESIRAIGRSPEFRNLSGTAASLAAQRLGSRSWMLDVATDLTKDALTRLLTPRR